MDFEYLGSTSLTVVGPVSRRRYFFDARLVPVVAVDPRDREALAAVPKLRELARRR